MSKHVIVGAGPVGSATAELLAAGGEDVTVVSRSGGGPNVAGVSRVATDATDRSALAELADGAVAIYNCASPAYTRWVTDWPPLAESMLVAATISGAVLATVSNLYPYGQVSSPMTESTPFDPHGPKGAVRAAMWTQALEAHRAGKVRVTEVRASDYVGGASESHLGARLVPRLLAGKKVQVLRSADTPHSWTYIGDVARLLVEVARDEQAWGRAWHVPTNAPVTQRQAVADLARVAGVPVVKVGELPPVLLRLLGLFNPLMRELPEVAYQLERPFIIDSSLATATFGLTATPWDDVLQTTIDHYRNVAAAPTAAR